MPASPVGNWTSSRDAGRGMPSSRLRPGSRSRPRSPRTERRARERHLVEEGYSSRWRDYDADRNLGRERMRDDGIGESERSAKRRRFDYQEAREPDDERTPSGNRESGGLSYRHHQRRREDTHRHRHHSARRYSAECTLSRKELPLRARQLSRSDLAAFRPLFAHYLDLQKRLDIGSLDETELRGRWKSFMGKWNRGELAEGWYDPVVFASAARDYGGNLDANGGDRYRLPSPSRSVQRTLHSAKLPPSRSLSPYPTVNPDDADGDNDDDDDDDEDAYGPPPPPPPGQPQTHYQRDYPPTAPSTSARAPGPSIPTQTDLSLRDEALAAEQSSSLAAHRLARRAHRAQEKALLDEVLPRAEVGTRERRLEKRRELNEKLKGFREKSPGEEVVGEGELLGGVDAVEEYRALLRAREERRKEKVSRREEAERARQAEREERVRAYREREERVVEGLKELARMRFGGGGR
ncbi:hypothetical protein N657DRAFT_650033 [Parathielavia appendiculata]|uniref:Uncharacterized protein n=1 Tax=Parathielavia appendiculata TaxID=2587402 RepID=A0AAN6TRR4_9PEZI|nr:hypothetical protein N657DRAFT_650033 [Parathielavia appendiculata]